MANIQLSTEGTGPRVATVEVSTEHRQIVVMGDVSSTAAGTTGVTVGSVALLGGSTANLTGYTLLSTGLAAAAIDPRQATIVGGTSGAGLGTIVSTAAGAAAIDPRQSTIVAATSGAGLGTLLSTGAGGAAIDARDRNWTITETVPISAGSTLDVRVIGAGSSGVIGTALISTGLTGAAIDPRLVTLQEGSSGTDIGVALLSTAFGSAAIDPRQATIVGGTSGTGIGVILSTAAGSAAIDPRVVSPSSQWTVTAQTGASTVLIGVIAVSTSTGTGTLIDPRQVTIVAATSGTGLGTILSTAAGGAAIDPRDRNWSLSTGDRTSATLLSSGATFVFATTASPSSDVMALSVRPVMGSTATTLGSVALLAGTTGNSVGSVALLAGSTANTIGAVAISTGTGPVRVYGDIAHDSTNAGNPVHIGGEARQTNPTAVADEDRVRAMYDDVGRAVVRIGHVRDLQNSTHVTFTSTSETQLIAAGGAGVYRDITHLTFTNESTSATVEVVLSASSGSGSTGYRFLLAERGGIDMDFSRTLQQNTANSAWVVTLQSAVTVDTLVTWENNV